MVLPLGAVEREVLPDEAELVESWTVLEEELAGELAAELELGWAAELEEEEPPKEPEPEPKESEPKELELDEPGAYGWVLLVMHARYILGGLGLTDQELVPLGPEDQSRAAPYAVAASAGTRVRALTILAK